jgi:oxygen-independent coproporphyrinogen-3 oxidase
MAGIYIHIPFCKQKCTYCDFHFSTTFEKYRSDMIDALCLEIVNRKAYLENVEINSIYFGGGTPSLLLEVELNQILNTVNEHFSVASNIELTIETNPDDVSDENLKVWKAAGINRLSIGLQSFKSEDLEWMNRAHTAEESLNCVKKAKKYGFENITVDLMYGLPNLTNSDWKNHILTAVGLGVTHISAYCLTIEENTVLDSWVKNKKIVPSSENEQSEQFNLLIETLEENGFEQYEISNFCKPNCEAVHNTNYWKSEPYLGIGPSAHSFNGTERSWNVRNNTKYIQFVNDGEVHFESETLTPQDQYNEMLLTGLRTRYGVDLNRLNGIIALEPTFDHQILDLINDGLMSKKKHTLVLTKKGRLMADRIASDLFIIA